MGTLHWSWISQHVNAFENRILGGLVLPNHLGKMEKSTLNSKQSFAVLIYLFMHIYIYIW